MFTAQWNVENFIAPLATMLCAEILKWIFVQIREHIKKLKFFLDFLKVSQYINQALVQVT